MKVEIVDYAAIPSTMTLLKLDALSHEEAQELQDRMPNLLDPPQAPKSDRPEDMLKAQEKREGTDVGRAREVYQGDHTTN